MSDDFSGGGDYSSGSYDSSPSSPDPGPSYEVQPTAYEPDPNPSQSAYDPPAVNYPHGADQPEQRTDVPTEAEITGMTDTQVYILLTQYWADAGRSAPYRDSRAQNRAALRRIASERRHRR